MIELATDNAPSNDTATANPVGLDLIGNAQQALAAFIAALVRTEVAKALTETNVGATAATLMDDSLNDRIRDVVGDFLDNNEYTTKEWVSDYVSSRIDDHCSDYDHDDFITEIDSDDVRDAVNDAISDIDLADTSGFDDAVKRVIREAL